MTKFVCALMLGFALDCAWAGKDLQVLKTHIAARSMACVGRNGLSCEMPAVVIHPNYAITSALHYARAQISNCGWELLSTQPHHPSAPPLTMRFGTDFQTGPEVRFALHALGPDYALLRLEDPLPEGFHPARLAPTLRQGPLIAVGYDLDIESEQNGRLHRVTSKPVPNPSLNGTYLAHSPWKSPSLKEGPAILFQRTSRGYLLVGISEAVVDSELGHVNYVDLRKHYDEILRLMERED
jgi:hypothetical protein